METNTTKKNIFSIIVIIKAKDPIADNLNKEVTQLSKR